MRLEVTRKSDLAVRLLRVLEGTGQRMKANELAEAMGSSAGFVTQVAKPLVDAHWIRSDPGPTGGYALEADLDEVTVLAVIEAMEGPTDTGRCVLANRPCDEDGQCALHSAWMSARRELLAELNRIPVSRAGLGDVPIQTGPRSVDLRG